MSSASLVRPVLFVKVVLQSARDALHDSERIRKKGQGMPEQAPISWLQQHDDVALLRANEAVLSHSDMRSALQMFGLKTSFPGATATVLRELLRQLPCLVCEHRVQAAE